MKEEMFRKSSLEEFVSPDKLDGYIKVTSPGAWALLGGIFFLLISAGIWCKAASLKSYVPITGIVQNGKIHAFASPKQAETLQEGMTVEQEGKEIGKIIWIAKEPVRKEEAGISYLTDYFRDTQLAVWNVEVTIQPNNKLPEGEEVSCFLVTKEIKAWQLWKENLLKT